MNTEMIMYTTAQLSVGVGREDLKFLPRFLLDINRLPCTKEWLISPSNMDEVFMKVVETNRDVENADVMLKVREEKEARKEIKLCVICGMNPAESVTMYNKKGKAYTVEGVYCKHCLEESSSESEGEQLLTVPPEVKEEVKEATEVVKEATEVVKEATEEVTDTSSPATLTQPLLTASHQSESMNTEPVVPLDVKSAEKTSACSVITSLTSLNTLVMLKDWKMYIILGVVLVLWAFVIILTAKLTVTSLLCPDGRLYW